MGSPFDILEENVMNVAASTFGYEASWTPSAGGPAQTGLVLFKDPTKCQEQLAAYGYTGIYATAEFKRNLFTGFKEAVDDTKKKERIAIRGTIYGVRVVKAKYDGDTYLAILDPKI